MISIGDNKFFKMSLVDDRNLIASEMNCISVAKKLDYIRGAVAFRLRRRYKTEKIRFQF